MYSKNDNKFSFAANKVFYTVEVAENLDDTISVYETNDADNTGFSFKGGIKQFILFINRLTDIAENLIKEDEEDEAEEII